MLVNGFEEIFGGIFLENGIENFHSNIFRLIQMYMMKLE